MPPLDLEAFAAVLPPRVRLLGLDVGTKTIGLAIADSGLTIASPLETIRRTKFTADAVALEQIVRARGIGGLIVGLPVNMDGSEGPRCQSVRQFARNLLERIDLPLAFWDERLSTMAVTRSLIEADMSRKRRSEVVDEMAAAFILQGALDWLRRHAAAASDGH
ncbi:MAG: Holliday junction resolvase RuvX [Dongiaceae bacterium]